ncbi:Adhesin/invasin TibA autotransporter precursor [Candidatus Bartonella washoeensis]|uniref:Outer membrane autotransporter barrel domain-containing protein n=1 Tax=Candidatus Bartonella washoeensis Sb944nv TaxID=1094563 RepID=J1JB74_9HYPH|nr:BafA family autotransporter [Bartonella washoeensis]EJF81637.1 outer membrane autotransporter barrel domain-containing protein [Bartonella washoeensis Sb944nv]SPU26125.1 Adhesin/invasin TibA autotransporter precursor [Bartonella washoeensis]
MQRKLRLSFWALMTSSFFVKVANTVALAAPGERPRIPVGLSGQLGEIGENIVSENLTVKNGQVEIVKKGETSKGIHIGKYGLQSVEYGGQTEEAKVYGGEQSILGEDSYAYNTEIHGKGETLGQQNVYDGGAAFFTDVMSGGEQNIDTWFGDEGGLAVDTKVFAAGVQNVFSGGKANTVTLEEGALQRVYTGGRVKTLTINDKANSLIYPGAVLEGEVKINDSGKLHLYAGDKGQQTKAEEIILNGKESKLYSVATEVNGSSTLIEKLSGQGSVIFTATSISTDSNKLNSYYSLLYIADLSGSIDFNLRVNFAERYGDYLVVEKGAGNHTISIVDSGAEITNSSFHTVDLITDKSGGAHFSLKNHSGEHGKQVEAVDGGAYMYSLQQRNGKNGEEKIWYLAVSEKPSASLITPSKTVLPITETLEKEEDIASLKDSIVSSYANDFTFYPDDFIMGQGGEILQSSVLSDDNTVYISDDGGTENPKWSFNNMVEGSGILYVEAGGFSKNTTVGDGGSEIVVEQGISESTIIYAGGKQRVEGGGSALKAEIYGGEQFVSGDGYVNGGVVGSSVYNTRIYGQGGILGQQNVYDDGLAVGTQIMNGGIQVLAKWFPDDDNFAQKSGGLAFNTEVFAGGMQRVFAGGEADTVILHSHAVQEVYSGGSVKNLTIEGKANSWVFAGAMLGGETTVHHSGKIHLYAGDDEEQTTVENINLEGEKARLYAIASGYEDARTHIQKLGGAGRVIFTSADSDLYYSRLYIDELSGSLHFKFHVSLAEGEGDSLFIQHGSGYHTISVVDSGIEIADPSSTNLDLITDQSGKAHFTLKKFSGAEISAVDGGTYMYGLKQREGDDENEKIWSLSAVFIDNVSFINGLPRSRNRAPRSLSQNQPVSVLSTVTIFENPAHEALGSKRNRVRFDHRRLPLAPLSVSLPEDRAVELSRPDGGHPSSDVQQQPAVSADASSLANQMLVRPSDQDQPSAQLSQELSVSNFLTTPSTDAVLSMSVTPGLVFHNELQTVRTGRGTLDRNKKNTALWTYAIKSKESVATGHIDFKLEQTGIVLGVSGLSELADGEFYIGGFGSYDQAHVTHARGGISGINTYSIGAYATYFDHSGLYLDGVLKYNQYQTNLKAVSTNGLDIEGNYNQWAVGSSFEAGYRFKMAGSGWLQPYAQFTWLQVEGKEIKLSNEMTGDIKPFISLRSEVGLSLGYEFGLGRDTSSLAYITAAWLRENRDNNHTTINQQHQFTTDLSGNAGKLGFGLSSLVSDRLKLYAEAHYVKGRKTKQALQGILGVRYSF